MDPEDYTDELVSSFVSKSNVYAVVGASNDPSKYGNKIYVDLKGAGYTVYPVNPKADEIAGDQAYRNLVILPVKPDVVNLVVPPAVTEKVVEECKRLGIKKVWMQPGSESESAVAYCKDNGISVLHDICIMVERHRNG